MKVNTNFVFRDIYGKYILMPVKRNDASDDPVLLNSVAAYIWLQAEKGKTFNEIVEAVSRQYDLQKDSMEEESVKQFITLMIAQKLLVE